MLFFNCVSAPKFHIAEMLIYKKKTLQLFFYKLFEFIKFY